jgi:hypothetical protein
MPRKRYETPEDRAKQQEVMDFVQAAWGDKVVHLPKSYQLDCAGIDDVSGEVEWIGEIKCRNHTSTKYDDLIISLLKFERGRTLTGAAGDRLPMEFYIIVKFEDAVMAHACNFKQHYTVTHGGRTLNTRDFEDVEPVVHIPMHMFFQIVKPVEIP